MASSYSSDSAVKKLNTMLRERDTQGTVLDRSTYIADLAAKWLAEAAMEVTE